MQRVLAVLPILALAACAGGHATVTPKTRLDVRVDRGSSATRYTLECRPAGGSAPEPGKACRALEDFVPRRAARRTVCMCAIHVRSITVTGILDGRRLSGPVEVSSCSACGLGAGARGDVEQAFAAFHRAPG
jgi:Subtilisin inhibitor-like